MTVWRDKQQDTWVDNGDDTLTMAGYANTGQYENWRRVEVERVFGPLRKQAPLPTIDEDGVLHHEWSDDGASYSLWLEDVDSCLSLSVHTKHSGMTLSLDVELARAIAAVCAAYIEKREA